jgi:hypothetical protein
MSEPIRYLEAGGHRKNRGEAVWADARALARSGYKVIVKTPEGRYELRFVTGPKEET